MNLKKELAVLKAVEAEYATEIDTEYLAQLGIKDIDDLEKYINENDFTERELSEIIYGVSGAFPSPGTKENVIDQTKSYLREWPISMKSTERPFFMDDLIKDPS